MAKQLTNGQQADDKSRRAKQKACIDRLDVAEAHFRKGFDELNRLREIFTTGATGTEPLWADFKRLWEKKTGDVYDGPVPAGKGVIRRLLKTLSSEDLRFRMVRYFEGDEPFRRRNGYSVTLFGQQIHSLGQAHSAEGKSEEQMARELSRRAGLFDGESS